MATNNEGPTIITVIVVFWAFALIAVGLRFWSREIRKRRILAHDLLILLGFSCATALTICVIVSVEYGGLGQHAINFISTPWVFITFGKLSISIQTLWCCSMTSIRLSMLNLYISLFSRNNVFRITCYAMMATCLLWAVGEILVVFLLCRPFQYNWDKSIAGSCGNLNAAYLIVHGSNFAIDFSIALLPTPVLWGLNMPTARKVGIMLMFALGALICAIAVARIALYQLALGYDQSDFTYTGWVLYLFTGMEPLLGCFLACMPLLQPVADMAVNSSVMSWTKSLIGTSSTRTQPPTGHDGYVSTSSQEGLHHTAHVIASSAWNKGWQLPDEGAMGLKGIYVNHEFEQSSFEMINKPEGK